MVVAFFIVSLQIHVYPTHAASLVVDSTADTNLTACSAAPDDCTLRGAINAANSLGGANTITFDATVFSGPATILLTDNLPDITSSLTLDGTASARVTVDGGNVDGRRVFTVNATGQTIAFIDLTVTGGNCTSLCLTSATNGGGIYAAAGDVSVISSTITNNRAGLSGAGIYSAGPLTISNSTVSSNRVIQTVPAATGGGVFSSSTLTITNSTFSGNRAAFGGGITASGVATVTNSTISGNFGPVVVGIRRIGTGGSITLRNTIVSPDGCSGTMIANANNVLASSCSPGGTDMTTSTPQLAALGSYGGSNPTRPPLPGSVALNAANNAICPPADQRGVTRPVATLCDVGAVESQGFTLAITGGDNQSTRIGAAFGAPLSISVSSAFGEPVNNGAVIFDAPDSGASLSVTTPQTATISSGAAVLSVTANVTPGSYAVPVTTLGAATGVSFSLTNSPPDLTVDRADDDTSNAATACTAAPNDCTLRGAIAAAEQLSGADVIPFDATVFSAPTTINLSDNLPIITTPLTVDGPDSRSVTIDAGNVVGRRVFTVNAGGQSVAFHDLTIIGGNCTSACSLIGDFGGGVFVSAGTVTITSSAFRGNTASLGGGVFNNAALTVTGSTFSENSATLDGGGIANNGTLTVTDSTINDNSTSGNQGGGIYNETSASISGSTISGNSADIGGGVENGGTLTITNSTISGNTASSAAGAIINYDTLTLINATLSGNTAPTGDGLWNLTGATATLQNTIMSPDDCFGDPLTTNANNVLSPSCSPVGTDITTSAPLLSALGSYGGGTLTMLPLPGSPAIDAANNATCPVVDQRGIPRPVNGTCDVGATESQGFTLAITGGNNQFTPIGQPFASPFTVTVSSAFGEPVNNGTVTFDAPDSGASLSVITAQTVVISGGAASLSAIANGTVGPYSVPVATAGAASSVSFSLTNTNIALSVDRTDDDTSPAATACTTVANDCTLRGAITMANGLAGADSITFDPVVFSAPTTIPIGSSIPISDSASIDGTGIANLTVSASGFRAFTVPSGVVVLQDFTVQGGGIEVSGGDVSIGASPLVITGSSTTTCGGGLLVSGGTVTVQGGSQINANTTTDNGGGICVTGGTLIVQGPGTQINANNAGMSGGGIYNNGGTVTVQSGAALNSNTAVVDGGGIANASGLLTVTGSYITNNAASNGDGIYSANGGSVTASSCLVGNGDTAVSNASGTLTATGNWWGTSWGPNIPAAPATTGSYVSSGDSIAGTGEAASSVNVGIVTIPANYGTFSTSPTGSWLSADPGTCGTCIAPSGTGAPRVCVTPRP